MLIMRSFGTTAGRQKLYALTTLLAHTSGMELKGFTLKSAQIVVLAVNDRQVGFQSFGKQTAAPPF